jgi:hypothetical protein
MLNAKYEILSTKQNQMTNDKNSKQNGFRYSKFRIQSLELGFSISDSGALGEVAWQLEDKILFR